MGLSKILWHKRFDDAQLGIFIKQAHVFFQEIRDISGGHVWGGGAGAGVVTNGGWSFRAFLAEVASIGSFLVTVFDAMALDFTVEALVVLH